MKYNTVVGIEIHLELNTKTKMFSKGGYRYEKAQNTAVNEVDLGFPGTLPQVNKEAVKKALSICHALDLQIDDVLKFDRKNYFYSDLPKGYQITQQFHPIGKNGRLKIEYENENGNLVQKEIGITRAHLEEDTAKQSHLSDITLIDYNRAGVPLVEIVSDPDMSSGEEAKAFVETLRQTMLYLGVSDCKMEEGSLRCDVNISIMPEGSKKFGTKVEIKNLNSINNVKLAIEYEEKRQAKILNSGGKIEQETRRFDDELGTTITMRKKEGAVDYKYFPDANIFPIKISDKMIKETKKNLPELPSNKKSRYLNEYKLSLRDTDILINNLEANTYYDKVMKNLTQKEAETAANILLSDLLGVYTKENITFENSKITAENFAKLIKQISDGNISSKQGKIVLNKMIDGKDPDKIIKEEGMKQISNKEDVLVFVNEVIKENAQSIEDYKNGKDRALGYMVGQIMKKSKGKANPKLATEILKQEIDKI